MKPSCDVVVIGAGLAGLLAAAHLAGSGATVTLVSFGAGGLTLGHGCLDILGYAPGLVRRPLDVIAAWATEHPDHPYAVLGTDAVRAGISHAAGFFGPLLTGSAEQNLLLPTALGGLRPTAYASPGMLFPDGEATGRLLVAGPLQLKDFQPHLVAGNLARALPDADVRAAAFDLPGRDGETDSSALTYARSLDHPAYRECFVRTLAPLLRPGDTVLLPAMLGLRTAAWRELSTQLDAPVVEVPLPPPNVPGMRLDAHAHAELTRLGVRFIAGSRVVGLKAAGNSIEAVDVATTGHLTTITTAAVVYAPGGFESGSLALDSHGVLTDRLGLPVQVPPGQPFNPDRRADQPLFRAGLLVDASARVLDSDGEPVHPNLFAAGGVLAGAMRWREKSGEGIAAASAWRAAEGALQAAGGALR